jgi:hypothetical protein
MDVDIVPKFFEHRFLSDELVLKLFKADEGFLFTGMPLEYFFEAVFEDRDFIGEKLEFIHPQFMFEVET